MDEKEIQEKRQQARLAMAGAGFTERQELKEADLVKRRQEAMIAMESSEQRMKREEKERLIHQREEGRRLIIEEKERHAEDRKLRQAREEEQDRLTKNRLEMERLRRQERFQAKKDLIEELKQEKNISVSPIRTLSGDMLKNNQGGIMTSDSTNYRQAPEKITYRAGLEENLPAENRSRKKLLFLTIFVLLIVSASFTAFFLRQNKTVSTNTEIKLPAVTAFIFTEKTNFFAIDDLPPLTIANTINAFLNSLSDNNTITNLQPYLTASTSDGQSKVSLVGLNDFIKRLRWSLPEELTRDLGDQFMIGSYAHENQNKLFFIFKIKEYEYARSWILKNEADFILKTFSPFRSEATINLFGEVKKDGFVDTAIKNKDLRVVKNQGGETLALYAFLDTKTLLVALDEATFSRVIDAFNTSRP